jgi:uncharacterized SAM-binding protein YcdF (DUF218 family)
LPFRWGVRDGDLPVSNRRPKNRNGVRALRAAALAGFAGAALLLIGFARFCIPLPADTDPRPTEAIVVLTGSSRRLAEGIALMHQGKGQVLFVSGVGGRAEFDEVLQSPGTEPPRWLACCTVLGHDAENTSGNAVETRQWIERRGFHSLRLVTSWWHMPRSLVDFERAMPNVEIVPHPVFAEHVDRGEWWSHGTMPFVLLLEYGKYLAALFLPVVDPPALGGWRRLGAEAQR